MSEAAAKAAKKTVNPEFQIHKPLNQEGQNRAHEVATAFDELFELCKQTLPDGPELTQTRMNLTNAYQHVQRGIARQVANQQ
jgi:hypothetical protein